jgi:hypothetical protein
MSMTDGKSLRLSPHLGARAQTELTGATGWFDRAEVDHDKLLLSSAIKGLQLEDGMFVRRDGFITG